MAKIDTLFMAKTAEKPYPLGPHIPIYLKNGSFQKRFSNRRDLKTVTYLFRVHFENGAF